MKRSDMLKDLYMVLDGWMCHDPASTSGAAEAVLKCVEEMGMLPPTTQEPIDEDFILIKHTWEPEDESKSS